MKPAQALIELIVAMGMLAIFLPALATGLITSSSGKNQNANLQQASALINAEFSALENIRNITWDNFARDGVFHATMSANTWVLASGTDSASFYQRWVTISPVERLNGNVVTSGGTIDPSTKKVEVSVSWDTPTSGNLSTVRYFTRYQDNFSEETDTQAEFDTGTKNSVATTNVSDGEVVLSGGGHGDWCQPALTQWGFNLNHNASGTAISAVEGRAFVVTGNNNASETFYDVNISNTYPPVAISGGVLTGQKKAYGVYGDQNYAYIATDTSKKQGVIIDLSNHTEIGWLDLNSASVNGRSIVVAGNYAYLGTTNSRIYIFDISSKTGTLSPSGYISLSAVPTKLVVVGSNLYASLDASTNQLAKMSISGSSLGSPSYLSVNGQNGRDVFVNSANTRAFLATATSVTQSELFVINLDTSQIIANQDTSGMDPSGVIAVTNNKVIIVGSGGYEYQVYNYNDVNQTFTTCTGGAGMLNIDAGVRGISSVVESDGDAYSYILTGDGSNEFKIIEGGPSGQTASSGSFLSSVFDAGHSTAFNRISWTADVPGGTSLQFQVAVADPVTSCADANFSFVGPDGTSSTYFTSPGALPLNDDGGNYQNPGQCFKYAAYFSTTDISQTPTLYDVTWGYSP